MFSTEYEAKGAGSTALLPGDEEKIAGPNNIIETASCLKITFCC
jgi:hypothetical protein